MKTSPPVGTPKLLPAGKTLSVAVCIGTYNQARYLTECIESVLAQTYPIKEILVSDDASTDETPEVMEKLCKLYPTVRYYRQPVNLGIAENLSWALAQPSTDLIARVDSDDRLEPDFAATLVDLMARYPQAGYGHGDVYEIDSEGVTTRLRRLYRSAVSRGPRGIAEEGCAGYRVAANCILFVPPHCCRQITTTRTPRGNAPRIGIYR